MFFIYSRSHTYLYRLQSENPFKYITRFRYRKHNVISKPGLYEWGVDETHIKEFRRLAYLLNRTSYWYNNICWFVVPIINCYEKSGKIFISCIEGKLKVDRISYFVNHTVFFNKVGYCSIYFKWGSWIVKIYIK